MTMAPQRLLRDYWKFWNPTFLPEIVADQSGLRATSDRGSFIRWLLPASQPSHILHLRRSFWDHTSRQLGCLASPDVYEMRRTLLLVPLCCLCLCVTKRSNPEIATACSTLWESDEQLLRDMES
jgi:hypothetical protein